MTSRVTVASRRRHTMAELYDMQHAPSLRDTLSYISPTSGERVGVSLIQPKSVDDLMRRREMVKVWMHATCGMFGRSPDFMNVMITGFAPAAVEFGREGPPKDSPASRASNRRETQQ